MTWAINANKIGETIHHKTQSAQENNHNQIYTTDKHAYKVSQAKGLGDATVTDTQKLDASQTKN